MGWNSTVVILHDALHDIARDPDFGRKLDQAIASHLPRRIVYAAHGNVISHAAEVICSYHADQTLTIRVGGNTGEVVPNPPPQPTRRPRATCPECGRSVSVSKAGKMRDHMGKGGWFCRPETIEEG